MIRTTFIRPTLAVITLPILLLVSPTRADIDVGSDGSDGVFSPTANFAFDLSQAASLCDCDGIDQGGDLDFIDDPCRWDCPSPVPGQGVYDAEQWAVIFKWSSVNIPAGVTVTFPTNHDSRAPVVWLSQGNVQINGTVNANGGSINVNPSVVYTEPGPGGFRGARATLGSVFYSPGFGPGASCTCAAGEYATSIGAGTAYGNASIIPLIGGSGGGGCASAGGGGGGGAILIASNQSILLNNINALITASGGYPNGSGGAIRLVADFVGGSGLLWANGGGESITRVGRIRVEANAVELTSPGSPLFVEDLPTFVFPPANTPRLRATMLAGVDVPPDPAGILNDPDGADVRIASATPVTLDIEAENVPAGTVVSVRVEPTFSPTSGGSCHTVVQSTPLADAGGGLLTGTANLTFPPGYSMVIMRASFNPAPLFQERTKDTFRKSKDDRRGAVQTLNGERVTRTEVTSSPTGRQQVVYVTETGRRIPFGR